MGEESEVPIEECEGCEETLLSAYLEDGLCPDCRGE